MRNVNSRTLTEDEERILALGLNFVVTPRMIPPHDIIAATESTTRQLDTEKAKKLREGVSNALHKARLPTSNLDRGMLKTMKDLQKDDSIVILPADKENATVVMDRTEYLEKMNRLLEDETYRTLKMDPTSKVEKKITKALKQLESKGYISDKERRYLSPQCSSLLQIYGFLKVHKEGMPFRPIVSAIGSPLYKLAKMLTRILSPLAGKTSSFIKKSMEFSKCIRETSLGENDQMISFDVVSLFTNVPITDALKAISSLVNGDASFQDNIAISPKEICRLAELCIFPIPRAVL